jgi:hypothetical protein
VYEFECGVGHKNVVVRQEDKFEVLFEIALNAIADSYHREAVSSATSSLERFYEYYTKVVFREHKISGSHVGKAWKLVSKQSERQLGMFVGAYVLHNRTEPTLLDQKQIEFRNAVIHKGTIPTREKALEYLEHVHGLILPLVDQIKAEMIESCRELGRERMDTVWASMGSKATSTMTVVTPLSMVLAPRQPYPSVEEALERIIKRGILKTDVGPARRAEG